MVSFASPLYSGCEDLFPKTWSDWIISIAAHHHLLLMLRMHRALSEFLYVSAARHLGIQKTWPKINCSYETNLWCLHMASCCWNPGQNSRLVASWPRLLPAVWPVSCVHCTSQNVWHTFQNHNYDMALKFMMPDGQDFGLSWSPLFWLCVSLLMNWGENTWLAI